MLLVSHNGPHSELLYESSLISSGLLAGDSQASNTCVQRGRERHPDADEKHAARPPLQRLVRCRIATYGARYDALMMTTSPGLISLSAARA